MVGVGYEREWIRLAKEKIDIQAGFQGIGV